ncbi:hypothetical protein AB4Y45_32400 [Paraburkholderia sp. EG287A]|uniref:hypothetical protein n=1 Tax=Paraburkholderia sp. EG287A TaxID=3237012 RepID=UPI0034D2FA16
MNAVISPMQPMSSASAITVWGTSSKVVDQHGRLLPVFRGQHGTAGHCAETLCASLSFGSARAASVYALQPNDHSKTPQHPKVFPVFLDIRNPFVDCESDPFMDLSHYAGIFGLAETHRLALKFKDHIYNTNAWEEVHEEFESLEALIVSGSERLMELCLQVYPLLDDADEVARLCEKGFDGAIHCGSGETAMEPEYRVFSKDQVRSIWDSSFFSC